jgi:hypothetical protein
MTEPHPQRCETCRNTKGAKIGDCEYYRICLKTNKRIWGYQAKFTSLVGCVSHSDSDKSSAAVLDEILEEMVDIDAWGEKGTGYLIIDDDVKAIIHRKKKELRTKERKP